MSNYQVLVGASLIFLLFCQFSSCDPLYRRFFPDYEDKGLFCNDGTPAGYFIRLAVDGAGMETQWLVHLQVPHKVRGMTAHFNR